MHIITHKVRPCPSISWYSPRTSLYLAVYIQDRLLSALLPEYGISYVSMTGVTMDSTCEHTSPWRNAGEILVEAMSQIVEEGQ